MSVDGSTLPHSASKTSCGSCCGSQIAVPAATAVTGPGRSFRVSGLDCAEEVGILNRALAADLGGEEHLAFDIINARMIVLDSAKPLSDAAIIRAVDRTGMIATPWDADTAEADHMTHLARQKRFAGLSAAFWALGLGYHIAETGLIGAVGIFLDHGGGAMPPVEIALFLLSVLFGAWLVAPKAWAATRRMAPDMNLLMMVAVAGAIALGEYFEAATVAFLFALSLALESWSVGRARNAVAALLDLAPPTARVIDPDGGERDMPAAQVITGALFVVRGGDRIPLDGVVTQGAGAVDQAPITGESALVAKEPGDEVYAGTINGEGTLTIRATRPASDTVLARITRMVGDAQSRRAQVEQWVTRFARVYTPVVMALAALIAVVPPLMWGTAWSDWIYNALVLLVIACPCALVISTPISVVAALAASARNGVLIKGGAYVEIPGRLNVIAMDKTGTLTEGRPEVAAIHPLARDEATLLAGAAALEARSSHPLAQAILGRAGTVEPASDTQIMPGRGVEGNWQGQALWLGSDRFATEKGLAVPSALKARIDSSGATLVAVGNAQSLWGVIELRDRIRPEAAAAIAELHAQGVEKIVMLTGDNARAAAAVAGAVGVDEVRAELMPQDKVAAVEELVATHKVVAMIGDGVNDAPAMARASFAVAMGAVGSDAAIETADIALMSDEIDKLPWLVGHSRRAMGVIHQNITFALATKALFVVLSAMGLATMWGAIAADVGVSLLVVANALRLLQGKPAGQQVKRLSVPGAARA